MQMYVYALAAERALGEPPAELVLHFLRPGVEHVFPWNDAARTRAIEMVNAMQSHRDQQSSELRVRLQRFPSS